MTTSEEFWDIKPPNNGKTYYTNNEGKTWHPLGYLTHDGIEPIDHVNPNHYKGMSNGAEVIDITENLTGNGAQAVQYIARSTRLDGNNKGNQVEDLTKAIWFCQREINRLKENN